MARELQDLCHSGPRRPRQACARLPACRKPRWRRMGSQSLRRARRRMRRRLPGSGPPSLAAEEGKPDHFGTCAMSGTVAPPGSWSDYNHCEVSVTVANPRAVFGRDAIDMMRFDTVDRYKCARAQPVAQVVQSWHFPRSIQGRSGHNRGRSPRSGHLLEQRRYATSEPEGDLISTPAVQQIRK